MAWALEPGDISWRTLGKEQGFWGGSVRCIIQDRRGLVWIGAAGGLYRYDGHSFAVFKPDPGSNSLVSSSISAVLEDRTGNLWVGMDGGGLARYQTIAGNFASIPLPAGGAGSSPSLRISALALDEAGRIIAGTAEGYVYRIDPADNRVSVLPRPESVLEPISSLLADSKGRLWAGTDGGGLLRWNPDGTEASRFIRDEGRKDSISSNHVSAIMEDSLGFVWIGFSDSGIDLAREGRFSHAKRHGGGAKPLPGVLSLAEDIKGQIWAGFRDGGVGILDPSRMEATVSPFAGGAEVTSLTRDRRGLMWMGLERGGLLTGDLRSTAFSRYPLSREGKPLGAIQAIAETPRNGIVIASRDSGLRTFDPSSNSFVWARGPDSGFDYSKVQAILPASDGSLWIGSSGSGILRLFPDGSRKIYVHDGNNPDSPVSSSVLSLLEGPDGKIWLGTDGEGLDLFDAKKSRFVHTAGLAGPTGSIVTCLAGDSGGRIWAGSADAGLSVLDPGGSRFRSVGRGSRAKDGIGDLRIECIFEDSRGMLWIGTGGGGLVALDPATGKVVRRGKDIGLFADAIYGLAEDVEGTLWISSSAGLFSLDAQRNDFFLLGKEDGLLLGGLDSGAIMVSRNGEVWVGSGEGITRFDPARIARYAPAPDVVISDIELMGGGAPVARSPDGTEITLGYDNMGLGFSIAAIDFSAPERNRYAMRLEGRQSAWTSMGNVNMGYIAPLLPGRYMLRVKAANGNGIWNDYGASLSILVSPPWWAAWWFRLLAIGSVLATVAGAIAARVGSLRRRNTLLVKFAQHIDEAREEERTIAARDVHDEIGQHLMVLNFRAYWLATHPEASVEDRHPVIKEMQQAILDAMASVKAVATRLRPAALDALDFPDALHWYVRSFGKMSGIDVKLQTGEGRRDLSKILARTFFRLLQEMLSNVARHSGALHVAVRFAREGDGFVLETRDDGKGIEVGKVDAQDSFGIIGMRERCVSIGGSLHISSAPGKGCTVTARLPVSAEEFVGRKAGAGMDPVLPLRRGRSKKQRGGKPC